MRKIDPAALDLEERVVKTNKVQKTHKGGRTLSWNALVVVGDSRGHVGVAIGKARGIPDAIRKGMEAAKKAIVRVELDGTTIPHQVLANWGASQVLLKPASPGTGIVAGGSVRAAAQSACRAGLSVAAFDLFRDVDLIAASVSGRRLRSLRELPAAVADLPPSVGDLFEAAFRGQNGEARPTPIQWVEQLEALMKRRKACSYDAIHVYFSQLTECPWCRIEDSGGPAFFVPSTGASGVSG